MKKILVAVSAAGVLALSACGATSGTVTDKTHTDGYYYYTYYPCGYKSQSMCPNMQYMPESWSLIVKQDSDGKYVGADVNVGVYESCAIGAHWERPTSDDKGHC